MYHPNSTFNLINYVIIHRKDRNIILIMIMLPNTYIWGYLDSKSYQMI